MLLFFFSFFKLPQCHHFPVEAWCCFFKQPYHTCSTCACSDTSSCLATGNVLHRFYKRTLMVMINDFVIQAVKPQEVVTAVAVRRFWYKQNKCLVIEHLKACWNRVCYQTPCSNNFSFEFFSVLWLPGMFSVVSPQRQLLELDWF